jgi:protocatechuate 3,4-dioxygenase beta subunit
MKNAFVQSTTALFNRREILYFLGGTALAPLLGCWRGQSTSVQSTSASAPALASTLPNCIVKPQQTEGPYFVDEKLNRSDIRVDPTDGSIRAGVPLRLIIQVSQVGESICKPLSRAIVDIWHCDAAGVYSDINDRSFNTVGKKFLRGYQVTNAEGIVEFVTVYPGWYPGRAVHIHFKIRTDAQSQSKEFTSQLYFDDALTDQVHAQTPYNKPGQHLLNSQDGIFQAGGEQLTLQLSQSPEGYVGRFALGLGFVA